MATTTENPSSISQSTVPLAAEQARSASRAADALLLLLVFFCGAAVMTIEMCASRLLAPYFGTSLFIWAILIGLVMIYLTIGYWLGGKLADRYPRPTVLFSFTAIAGFAVGLIPVLSRPSLAGRLRASATIPLASSLAHWLG